MKFLEKDLEQIIFESGRDSLRQKGLTISGKLFRQMKIGNYGIADLVSFSRPNYYGPGREYFDFGSITIYELKKDQVGISAFLQAINYARGIQSYLKKRNKLEKYVINIVLIGKEIDTTGSFCYIPDLLSLQNDYTEHGYISFVTYEYNLDGLEFVEQYGYSKKDEGF